MPAVLGVTQIYTPCPLPFLQQRCRLSVSNTSLLFTKAPSGALVAYTFRVNELTACICVYPGFINVTETFLPLFCFGFFFLFVVNVYSPAALLYSLLWKNLMRGFGFGFIRHSLCPCFPSAILSPITFPLVSDQTCNGSLSAFLSVDHCSAVMSAEREKERERDYESRYLCACLIDRLRVAHIRTRHC